MVARGDSEVRLAGVYSDWTSLSRGFWSEIPTAAKRFLNILNRLL